MGLQDLVLLQDQVLQYYLKLLEDLGHHHHQDHLLGLYYQPHQDYHLGLLDPERLRYQVHL